METPEHESGEEKSEAAEGQTLITPKNFPFDNGKKPEPGDIVKFLVKAKYMPDNDEDDMNGECEFKVMEIDGVDVSSTAGKAGGAADDGEMLPATDDAQPGDSAGSEETQESPDNAAANDMEPPEDAKGSAGSGFAALVMGKGTKKKK